MVKYIYSKTDHKYSLMQWSNTTVCLECLGQVLQRLGGAVVSKQVGIVGCIQPRPRIDLVPNICHHCVQIVIASSLVLSFPLFGVLVKGPEVGTIRKPRSLDLGGE